MQCQDVWKALTGRRGFHQIEPRDLHISGNVCTEIPSPLNERDNHPKKNNKQQHSGPPSNPRLVVPEALFEYFQSAHPPAHSND